jgi:integrase
MVQCEDGAVIPHVRSEIDPERLRRPFVTFVAQTGLRIGEAIAVQWRDVDLDSGLLHIRRRYYRSAYAPPKTRYGRRVLPLTPAMAALLRSRWALLEPGHTELVWPSRTGRPLNPDTTRARVLKPAALRAAVPWASWHTLRHTCGTLLFREGWSIKAVQHYLGHHSAAFTLAVYVHFLPGDMPSNAFLDGIVGTPGLPSAEERANLHVRRSTSDT